MAVDVSTAPEAPARYQAALLVPEGTWPEVRKVLVSAGALLEELKPSANRVSRYELTVPTPGVPVLTVREMQVLRGMADGQGNKQIGEHLYLSEDTIKTHGRRLFKKLGARDRTHAVAIGFQLGILGGTS